MKRFSFFIAAFILAGFIVFIGCDSGDDGSGTPSGPTIDAPTNLTAVAESDNEILLNWSYASNEATFILEKTSSGDEGWMVHAELQAGVKTYTDVTGVSEGQILQYRVKASLNDETSDPSDAVSVSTPPIPPTDLIVSATTSTSVSLGWTDASSVEDGYEIQRRLTADAEEDFETVNTTDADVSTYVDDSVVNNSTYNYRVRAIIDDLVSPWTDEITATTATIPTGLTAETISDNEILLIWEDTGSEYRLENKAIDADEWATVAELEIGDTSYTDTGLEEAAAWCYRVYSVIEAGESEPSETVIEVTMPMAPTDFTAEQDANTTTTIIVSWTDKSSKESMYQLRRRVGVDGDFQGYRNLDADTESFEDTDLQNNQTYYYKIAVVAEVVIDEDNTVEIISDWSDIATAGISLLTPDAPTDLTGNAIDHTSISLTWTDNSDNELGFTILKGYSRFGEYTELQSTAVDIVEYVDLDLEEEMQYFYKVFAFNEDGNSDTSDVISVITPEGPPATPQNLEIDQVGYSHFSFTWDDVSDNEFGFVIDKSIDTDDNWIEYERLSPDTGYYYDRNIEPLTTYYYRVYAFNQAGNSGYSGIISATSLVAPPMPPTNLSLRGNPTLVRIPMGWTDNSDNEEGFIIERRAVPSWNYTVLDTLDANTVLFSDRFELEGNTEYGYHIAAFNSSGGSGWSLELRVTTPPVPPQAPINLTATSTNLTEVDLVWEFGDFNDIVDFYEIERRDGPDEEFEYLSEVEGLDNTEYHDTGLEPNEHTYWYRVRANNEGGYSDWSGIAVVTTPALDPPEDLEVSIAGITSLELEWTYNYEVNFVIERGDEEMGEYAEVGTSDTTVYVDNEGLEPDSTIYWYRVKAVVDVHESDWSDPASGSTPFVTQLDEGFEDWEVDEQPGDPWTYNSTGDAFFRVTDQEAHDGDQSLHFADPEDASTANIWAGFNPIPEGEMTFWLKATPGGFFGWYVINVDDNGDLLIVIATMLRNDGSIWVNQGGQWSVAQGNWDTEDWFLVTITWGNGAYSMDFDDENIVDGNGVVADIPVSGMYYLTWTGDGAIMENGWLDEILIEYAYEDDDNRAGPRRYTVPENPIRVDPRTGRTIGGLYHR